MSLLALFPKLTGDCKTSLQKVRKFCDALLLGLDDATMYVKI